MKRVIKFHSRYQNDAGKFSDCSTRYEVLPILVEDSAGPKELKAIAKQLGLYNRKKVATGKSDSNNWNKTNFLTHSLPLGQYERGGGMYSKEKYEWQLGFITLKEGGTLEAISKVNQKMTLEQAESIRDEREYGVADTTHIKDEKYLVMESWKYYHQIKLLGYSLEHFEKLLEIDDRTFEDEVDSCSECGESDWRDNGYTYNFRYIESEGSLGLNCGCFDEFCKNNVEHYVNNHKECMELEIAKELEDEGTLEFVERFIGGWTDGRGGSFGGERTREGTPEGILKDLLKKNPKAKFVFTHDESGQFQTYFSIWKVVDKKVTKKTKKRAQAQKEI